MTEQLTQATVEAGEAAQAAGEKIKSAFPVAAGAAVRSVPEQYRKVRDAAEEAGEALAEVAPAAEEALAGIGGGAAGAAAELQTAFQAVPEALAPIWQQIPADAQSAFSQVTAGAQAVGPQLLPPFQAASTGITASFSQMVAQITALLQELIGVAARVAAAVRAEMSRIIAAANAAKAAVASVPSGGGGGFAAGGPIFGPGTGTSDDVPIWASAGEALLRERAVSYYGWPALSLFNDLRIPREALVAFLKGLRGFRDGGPVLPRFEMPRFNAGGIVDSINFSLNAVRMQTGGPVTAAPAGQLRNFGTLELAMPGGERFPIMAPVDVLSGLERAVNRLRLTQAGRGPARLRG